MCKFAQNNEKTDNMEQAKWSENVILVDAGYLDRVAFDLTVNFERMINRPVPAADLCHWLDCVALDGGITLGQMRYRPFFCTAVAHRDCGISILAV